MNEEKNAHDAHKDAQKPSTDGGAKESKLDKWIRQNVLGEHRPEEKIVHQPAPQRGQPAPARGPQPHPKSAIQPVPQSAAKPPKKGGFFFGRRKKEEPARPASATPPAQQPGAPAPAKGAAPPQRPAVLHGHAILAGRPAQPARPGQPPRPPQPSRPGQPPRSSRPPRPAQKKWVSPFKTGPRLAPNQTARASQQPGQTGRPTTQPAYPGFPAHRPAYVASNQPGTMPGQPQRFQGRLRIIPLGGLNEIGKNCMALEYGDDIMIIDLGFQFPEEDMLGVDYVIPDISYLNDKMDRIRGVVFTHGHLDHIGAVPYLIPRMNFPQMYATKLTVGLIEKRLEEFGLQSQAKLNTVTAEDTLQLGVFTVSFFRVNHSIPDAVGIVVKTPAGNIVHTGDFKFDFTPSGDQAPADFAAIASLSGQNIGALFIDSTNALKPGYTVSERKIGQSLENIVKNIEGRVIIASFASQIGRIQQVINFAKKYDRTIFLSGRSLIDNCFMAQKLGYLNFPDGLLHDVRKAKKIPEHKVLILTTGSQGEDVSALTRMALEEHPAVKIGKGDTVILSSSPIPGNERAIATVTNNLSRLGARIINNQIMDVHASGHAQQEDLKLMINLVKPRFVVPIHGEFHMRTAGKEVAMSIGYDEAHTMIIENGGVLEMENNELRPSKEEVPSNYVLIDGLGVGDIGAQVIMDRQTLAENGVLIVLIPVDETTRRLKGEIDIISRGFVYMKEAEELTASIASIAADSYRKIIESRDAPKRAEIKKYLRESIDKFVHQKIERHPLVIPIIVEQ